MRKFVIGALIGAGVALLYAPATGARTRSLLRDKSNRLKNDLTDFVEAKQRHIANKIKGYKAQAERAMNRAKETMSQGDAEASEPQMAGSGEPSI